MAQSIKYPSLKHEDLGLIPRICVKVGQSGNPRGRSRRTPGTQCPPNWGM